MGNLIIAEKTNAAIRIASSLSEGKIEKVKLGSSSILKFKKDGIEYSVLPLRGHIIELDFPKEYSNWRTDKLKEMVRVNPEENLKYKGLEFVLEKLNQQNETIILATDYDREGELIGVETLRLMGRKNDARRAKFSSLTKAELQESFSKLEEVDFNLADSAEAREVIDLLWGATLTRFFSIETKRLGKEYLSVGRVQSPTLTILVKKETEIRDFVPEKYYELTIDIAGTKFRYDENPIKEKKEADVLYDRIKDEKSATVKEVTVNDRKIFKPVPFSTTEFLRDANRLGISVEKAMAIAETLYQHGKISYPRTDNTVYPRTLGLKSILKNLEDSYLKEEIKTLQKESRLIPSRGRTETTDHPPIYPTSSIKKTELKGDYFRIYDLIARRFMSTLSENADIQDKQYKVGVEKLYFSYTASKAVNLGWMRYYPLVFYREKPDPGLETNGDYEFENPQVDEKETSPPPRYSQGSLLEKMDKERLGTKSTRHDIIKKLYDRGFIEGNPIKVRPLGMAMGETLLTNSVSAANPEMTARLEEEMDHIASGKKNKNEVIDESRSLLLTLLEELIKKSGSINSKFYETLGKEKVAGKCPKCNSDLIIDWGRNSRYIKCTGPSNDFFFYLPKTGKIELTDEKCEDCGLFHIKVIRRGERPEIRCIDPKCSFNMKKEVFGKCPSDGGNLILRRSRVGRRFIGCSNYPNCTVTVPLPLKGEVIPTEKSCEVDQYPIAVFKFGRREVEQCLNPKCPSRNGTVD